MPLKAVTSTTPGASSSGNDTSKAGTSKPGSQVVAIGQLKVVIEQINKGQEAFNNKLKDIGTAKVKLPAVK